ncbi:MAG: SH3 domain-containing protein [Clostridia bacterium]|nr:SH3 domain-containing protein [Clostridia bacterium]
MNIFRKIVIFSLMLCLIFAFTANSYAKTDEKMINFGVSDKIHTNGEVQPCFVSPNPPSPGYVGYCAVTAEPYLNVRSGPGTSYSVIGTALYGDWVYVVQVRTDGWTKIQSPFGGYGYVSTAYLSVLN